MSNCSPRVRLTNYMNELILFDRTWNWWAAHRISRLLSIELGRYVLVGVASIGGGERTVETPLVFCGGATVMETTDGSSPYIDTLLLVRRLRSVQTVSHLCCSSRTKFTLTHR